MSNNDENTVENVAYKTRWLQKFLRKHLESFFSDTTRKVKRNLLIVSFWGIMMTYPNITIKSFF